MQPAGHGPWLYWPPMHIPRYWAQARLRHETGQRHGATVQRWGWSDSSPQEAEAHARQRAQEALDALLAAPAASNLDAGFERMEWRGEYGLDGTTPIREEVLERRGDTVLTRNSYGAHCLNTEQVAIADMDFPEPRRSPRFPLLSSLLLAAALGWLATQPQAVNALMLAGIVATALIGLYWLSKLRQWQHARTARARAVPPLQAALERVRTLASQHPDWSLRLYQTPKGLRVIVTHATFGPGSPEVQILFDALAVDPLYAMLCDKQQCFRARVTGKPWRMGLSGLSSQDRQWPPQSRHLPSRTAWCRDYDRKAAQFAACHFIEQLGPGASCPQAQAFVQWHDQACNARTALPLA